jgi:hypothetical protein
VDGSDAGTTAQYAQQAVTLADQSQQAVAKTDKWESLGVFAPVLHRLHQQPAAEHRPAGGHRDLSDIL